VGETLNDTLVKVRLRLEQGLEKADQELAEMRERCIRLELEIRSIRAYRSDLALLAQPDVVRTVDAGSDAAVISIPEAAAESVAVAKAVAEPAHPAVVEPAGGAVPAAVSAPAATSQSDRTPKPTLRRNPAAESAEEESLSSEIPTSYMPMLEELWDIARQSDAE
jgi:hypothetical protein